MPNQLNLFGATRLAPDGFKYQPDVLSPADERTVLERLKALPIKDFEFHGYVGKRRVVSYGWQYDFNDSVLRRTDDIPPFLLSLREAAAACGAAVGVPAQRTIADRVGAQHPGGGFAPLLGDVSQPARSR